MGARRYWALRRCNRQRATGRRPYPLHRIPQNQAAGPPLSALLSSLSLLRSATPSSPSRISANAAASVPATRRHALQGVARRIGGQDQERLKTPLVHNFSISAFQNVLCPLTSDLCFSVCQHFRLSAFDSVISGFCFPNCCFSECPSPGRQAGRAALLGNTRLTSDLCFQHVSLSAFQLFRVPASGLCFMVSALWLLPRRNRVN